MNQPEQLEDFEQEIYNTPDDAQKPFEREYDVSQHLLAIGKYKGKAINEDSPRANNNPLEMQATRSAARVINRLEYAEKVFGWDFTNLIDFFEGTRSITDVTGRGKHGWISSLTKTNYNVQQVEQLAQDVTTDYGLNAEQSLKDKIAAKIPCLKKKEM